MASYAHLSQLADKDLAIAMTRDLKVACIPISVFYSDKKDDKIIRFCFAKTDQELLDGLSRLQNLSKIL